MTRAAATLLSIPAGVAAVASAWPSEGDWSAAGGMALLLLVSWTLAASAPPLPEQDGRTLVSVPPLLAACALAVLGGDPGGVVAAVVMAVACWVLAAIGPGLPAAPWNRERG